jgi:large subunit ribosomal protein L4
LDVPSTKEAAKLLADWGQASPTLVVVGEEEETLAKSFRNIDRVAVTVPSELEVTQVVWARSLLVSQAALDAVQGRAQ